MSKSVEDSLKLKVYNSAPQLMSKSDGNSPNKKILYNSSDGKCINLKSSSYSTPTIIKPLIKNEQNSLKSIIYKIFIESSESKESKEEEKKSDIAICYDEDGSFNFFELSVVCQQIKCTGLSKTPRSSFDLIMNDYKVLKLIDNYNYLILSKNFTTKTVRFIKKSIAFSAEQFVYFPMYVISDQYMNMSEFEILLPYLMYNIMHH